MPALKRFEREKRKKNVSELFSNEIANGTSKQNNRDEWFLHISIDSFMNVDHHLTGDYVENPQWKHLQSKFAMKASTSQKKRIFNFESVTGKSRVFTKKQKKQKQKVFENRETRFFMLKIILKWLLLPCLSISPACFFSYGNTNTFSDDFWLWRFFNNMNNELTTRWKCLKRQANLQLDEQFFTLHFGWCNVFVASLCLSARGIITHI